MKNRLTKEPCCQNYRARKSVDIKKLINAQNFYRFMKEIEILVKVLEPKKSALKKLAKFHLTGSSTIEDNYYYNPNNKNMFPKKDFGITEFFRIRNQDGKYCLTYKKDNFSGKKWLYSDENETKIEDGEIAKKIISNLGLKPLVTVHNKRTFFYYKNYGMVE